MIHFSTKNRTLNFTCGVAQRNPEKQEYGLRNIFFITVVYPRRVLAMRPPRSSNSFIFMQFGKKIAK